MGYKLNPFTGNLDAVDSPNGVFEAVEVNGDITLDDGGTYTTTLQTITPTANRTVSLPNATGTVALVAGSSGQLVYNNAGAQAGAPGSVVGATGDITLGLNGAASTPPLDITGTWFTGGTSTTTKPQVLIEPAGTTSTAWSTSGTGLGVNAASGFAGRLLDLQLNGTSNFNVDSTGRVSFPLATAALPALYPGADTNTGMWSPAADTLAWSTNGVERMRIDASGVVKSSNSIRISNSGGGEAKLIFTGTSSDVYPELAGIYSDSNYGASTATSLLFKTTQAGSTSPTERLSITSAGILQVAEAGNISVGTTTGTKIGTATTQKLGFYNKTPVVQPVAVADATTAVDVITQLNALLARMRDLGLIAT